MSIETTRALAQHQGGVTEAFGMVVFLQKKAFVGHLKCVYFLAKQKIAHTTNCFTMVTSGSLGQHLRDIAIGGNTNITSEPFVQEIVKLWERQS